MWRKVISLITLLAFMVFSFSCYTRSEKKVETVAKWKIKKAAKVKILAIMKKNGDRVKFVKDSPGKIVKDGIRGKKSRKVIEEFMLKNDDIRELKSYKDKPSIVITKDGRILKFNELQEKEGQYIFKQHRYEYETVFVPFSEVEWVKVEKLDGVKSVFMVMGIIAGLWILVMGLFAVGILQVL